MDISAALSRELATLTEALDCDDIDLATQLDELSANLRRANLGMTIMISGDGDTITFSAGKVTAPSPVPMSPVMPLSAPESVESDSPYVRFAEVEVFVDLAADAMDPGGVDTASGGPDCRAVARTAGPDCPSTLQRCSSINQAVGVLIGRGRTLGAAHEELAGLADFGATDLYHAAEYLLHGLADRRPALVTQ